MAFKNRLIFLPAEYVMPGELQAGTYHLASGAEITTDNFDETASVEIGGGAVTVRRSSDDEVLCRLDTAGPDYIRSDEWHPLATNAPWVPFGAPAQGLEYRAYPDGRVYVRATLTTGGTAVPNGTLIATLPAGYRPPREIWTGTITSTTGTAGNLVIAPSGNITLWDFGGPRAVFPCAINTQFALD